MKLSLCLEMLFTELPFADRIRIASQLGYDAIEFWDFRNKNLGEIGETSERHGLIVAAMSGNRRNALIDPGATSNLVEEMAEVFEAANRVKCRNIMMLSDVLSEDGSSSTSCQITPQEKLNALVENLRTVAAHPEAENFTLLLEPLNTALDHRGCFLDHSATGTEIVRRVNSANVKLLYDIYHMSMMNEDVQAEIEKSFDWIGYFHVADIPGRHQPGTGKIDYEKVNALLEKLHYDGFVGMEFSALDDDEAAAAAPLNIFNMSRCKQMPQAFLF
jgi:hydroxypyruvate isomerase